MKTFLLIVPRLGTSRHTFVESDVPRAHAPQLLRPIMKSSIYPTSFFSLSLFPFRFRNCPIESASKLGLVPFLFHSPVTPNVGTRSPRPLFSFLLSLPLPFAARSLARKVKNSPVRKPAPNHAVVFVCSLVKRARLLSYSFPTPSPLPPALFRCCLHKSTRCPLLPSPLSPACLPMASSRMSYSLYHLAIESCSGLSSLFVRVSVWLGDEEHRRA